MLADWTPICSRKKRNDRRPWKLIEVHHYVSWQINFPGGEIYNLLLVCFLPFSGLFMTEIHGLFHQVISLELSTGIPMLYIFKEGKFVRRGSPSGPSEAGVYAYTKVWNFAHAVLEFALDRHIFWSSRFHSHGYSLKYALKMWYHQW